MNLPQPIARGLPRLGRLCLGALAVLAALVGCGPTGGGTGTGTDSTTSLADFGATAASSCSSPFAGSLACASVSSQPVGIELLAGTAPVSFSGGTADGLFELTLTGNVAELSLRCLPLRFVGTWGLLPSGEGRYFGDFHDAAGHGPQSAQLVVQADDGGLRVTVFAVDGRTTLLLSLTLRPLPAPTGGSCR